MALVLSVATTLILRQTGILEGRGVAGITFLRSGLRPVTDLFRPSILSAHPSARQEFFARPAHMHASHFHRRENSRARWQTRREGKGFYRTNQAEAACAATR